MENGREINFRISIKISFSPKSSSPFLFLILSSNLFQIKRDQGRIEKWVLRRAFDDEQQPYLPKVFEKKELSSSIQKL